jgi:hypothetical protein
MVIWLSIIIIIIIIIINIIIIIIYIYGDTLITVRISYSNI